LENSQSRSSFCGQLHRWQDLIELMDVSGEFLLFYQMLSVCEFAPGKAAARNFPSFIALNGFDEIVCLLSSNGK